MNPTEPQLNPFSWIDARMQQVDEQHLRRSRRLRASVPAAEIQVDGQRMVNFSSNDYLGLARDPRLIAAAITAAERYGWGSGASPLITGHSELHRELESALANFESAAAALLFPTGYAANVGAVTALADGSATVIYSDAKNHASIIDGCRLSGAKVEVYQHNDCSHLANLLADHVTASRKLIVTDGLFSMDGDIAPLQELARLAELHGAMLLVDEAHATGVLGDHGRGSCELCHCESEHIVRVGTLSKSLGSHGGFVVGSRRVIDWMINCSRTLMFSTAAPPAVCAAGLAALKIVESEPQRREVLLKNATELRRRLSSAGYDVGDSHSQIIPIRLGTPQQTMLAAVRLRESGILVPGIRPPSVPAGESLLRISLSFDHTPEMIEQLIAALPAPSSTSRTPS